MTTREFDDIKGKVLSALSSSLEQIDKALHEEGNLDYHSIWFAYSRVELAIGLTKLILEDPSGDKAGTFRELKLSKERRENLSGSDMLFQDLQTCRENIQKSWTNLHEGTLQEGLQLAQSARDILKIALLKNKRSLASKR